MYSGNSCIQAQVASCSFGHQARDHRFSFVMKLLMERDISESFPSLFGNQYQLKNFYRFVNNASVSHQKIMEGYQQGLIQYSLNELQTGDQQTWYMIHDSSFGSYNKRKKLDLGYTEQVNSNGFMMHHGLLLDARYEPLGLWYQQIIVRDRQDYGKRHKLKERAFETKESYKWIDSLTAGKNFEQQGQRKVIHIMDREADITEVFNTASAGGQSLVVRARHNRSFLSEKQRHVKENKQKKLTRLWDYLRTIPASVTVERALRDAEGTPYQSPCQLHYGPVELRGIHQSVWVVYLKEMVALEVGKPAIEWRPSRGCCLPILR